MAVALPRVTATRHGWTGARALAAYTAISVAFFGVRLLLYPGQTYVGFGSDGQIFIWAFAWWPHAILHGLNPFYTHAIWAPPGVNLTWTTSTPGLALAFAPVTWLAGPFVSYNAAAILMPALAAWTAYLLCRHLTGSAWPSLAGGYLFGFSSYMLGQEEGHLHMTSVFLVPLAALLVVRNLEGEIGSRGLALRLGPLLALQVSFSTELAFTLTLALGVAIVLWIVFAPSARRRLVALLAPLAAAYAVAGALLAPFLYYLLTGFHRQAFQPPGIYVADLLNFVVPTRLEAVGAWWANGVANSFPGNNSERDAFLGPAVLAIVVLFVVRFRRTARARVLLALLAVGFVAALGGALFVDGHDTGVPLPWGHIGYWPLFDNTLPVRLTLFISLLVSVAVAIWSAAPGRLWPRVLLPVAAVLSLIPNPASHAWEATASVPAFFTSARYRACLRPNEIVLPLPISGAGDEMAWQAANGFRFRMAGGHITAQEPAAFLHPASIAAIADRNQPPVDPQVVLDYVRTEHVSTILLDERVDWLWRPLLDRIAPASELGGVLVYRVDGSGVRAGCPIA